MPSQNKPNVILFIVDELSAKWLEAARDEKSARYRTWCVHHAHWQLHQRK